MAASFKAYIPIVPPNGYINFLLGCLQLQRVVFWSLGFLALGGTGLQAATVNSISSPFLDKLNSQSQFTSVAEIKKLPSQLIPELTPVAQEENPQNSFEDVSVSLHYQLQPQSFLIAAPDNFNPNLRLESPSQPSSPIPSPPPLPIQSTPQSPESIPPPTSTTAETSNFSIENLQIDFRNDLDNFDRENRFIEPTAQFRLSNGNRIRVKTGFNTFEQPGSDYISNIPLRVEYEAKIDKITLQTGIGVDFFNTLPTAINFNAKVDAPLSPNLTLSAVVEQGSYKFNAQTLENQITSWRYGPQLYWQIDPKTSLFSSLRVGHYNDGNFEQQSFTRIERKFGEFFLSANLFNWSYQHDYDEKSGYFSPPDFLVYTGEVGWEGRISEFLRCRVAASLGQQRLNGEFDNANSYQGRCTTNISPNVDADLGYTYSNVQNGETGGSTYNNQFFTGVLRVKF